MVGSGATAGLTLTATSLTVPATVHWTTMGLSELNHLMNDSYIVRAKATGSYTNYHERKNYHGKGGKNRANKSAKEKAEDYDDPLKDQDWKPVKNDREAFKDEFDRLKGDGGAKNPNNYNKRESPGKTYKEQDGK